MSGRKAFQAALNSAHTFLQPVFQSQATAAAVTTKQKPSIIDTLYDRIPQDALSSTTPSGYSAKSSRTVEYVLKLLAQCNNTAEPKESPDALYAPRDRRIILGLADLVLLEGIYPNVTDGILPPLDRRTKSSGYFSQLQTAIGTEKGKDSALLGLIVDTLEPILATASNEVSDAVCERLQMDVVACMGELAFNPELGSPLWKQRFYNTLEGLRTSVLLPLVTPLLQSTTPEWFRKELATYLSQIPLERETGVRDIINFFLDAKNDVSAQRVALQQASKLIGSVPSTLSAESFFPAVVSQLYLLVDAGGPLGTAAAIIVNDIVERRKKSVEKFFFSPLVQHIRPSKSQIPPLQELDDGSIITLASESQLEKALAKVARLTESSPGYITTRLIGQLVLPLWSLWQYATSLKAKDSIYTDIPKRLLFSFIKLRTGHKALIEIAQNSDFNGELHWRFSRGDLGGVKIVSRDLDDNLAAIDPSTIEEQIPMFMELALATTDDGFTDFFLALCRNWLQDTTSRVALEAGSAYRILFQLKLLEGILDHHAGRLAKRPEQIIVLIKEILDQHVQKLQLEEERRNSLKQPSLQNLDRILSLEGETGDVDESTNVEAIMIALQLLNSVVSSSFDRIVSEQEKKLLTTIQPSLKFLSDSSSSPSSISSLCRSISLFISAQGESLADGITDITVDEKTLKQQQDLQTALLYLGDEMVPIRAHGLELLQALVLERAPVIDVPTVTKLLVDMLQDKESFVYLNVVKTLCTLADKHPSTVIGFLLGAYVDENEKMGIDERLKVGEALMGAVKKLGETAIGKVAEQVGNVMLGLAGRRKTRYKEAKELKQEVEDEAKRNESFGKMDEEYAKVLKETRAEAGIEDKRSAQPQEDDEQWISKTGEEDYRVRTSAISILGILYETNAIGVAASITTSAVDVALSILSLERHKDQATIRRAAVHLISTILSGLEQKGAMELLKVISNSKLQEIVRVLSYARSTDDDGLVREQARALLEILTE